MSRGYVSVPGSPVTGAGPGSGQEIDREVSECNVVLQAELG